MKKSPIYNPLNLNPSPQEELSIKIYNSLWKGLGAETLYPYGYDRWIEINNGEIFKIIKRNVKKQYKESH